VKVDPKLGGQWKEKEKLPLEGEGKTSNARRPMEGEGEASNV